MGLSEFYRPSHETSYITSSSNNLPSGIAQLRKTSDLNLGHQSDPMNLDDFIFPENVVPAATLSSTHSPDTTVQQQKQRRRNSERLVHTTTAGAIPIKSRKNVSPSQPLIPQSVPVAPHQRHQDEFGYVTRHHRKTSIDERRVSIFALLPTSFVPWPQYIHPWLSISIPP